MSPGSDARVAILYAAFVILHAHSDHVEAQSEVFVRQDEAKRVAEQMRALEETRAKMTADLGAREAALTQREDAAAAAARKREEDMRRRAAQDEQVPPTVLISHIFLNGPQLCYLVHLAQRSAVIFLPLACAVSAEGILQV